MNAGGTTMTNVTPIDAARPAHALASLCKDCGLDPKNAAAHGLVALAPHETHEIVGVRAPSIGFVYHQADGTPIGVHRVRFVDPPDGTPKYKQRASSAPRVYFPQGHGIGWEAIAETGTAILVVTEGEKKAHAGCAAGMPTVGIGGVWMGAKKAKRKASSVKLLLPELRTLFAKVQHVVVAFDSDKVTNPLVEKAEGELLSLIRGLGVEARNATIPPGPNGEKQGLDDYLMAEGKRSAPGRYKKLLEDSTVSEDMNSEWVTERNEDWYAVLQGPGYVMDQGERLSFRDFRQKYPARRATWNSLGKLVDSTDAEVWLTHPKRRAYQREVFDPKGHAQEGVLNHFQAPVKPRGYKPLSLRPFHEFVRSMMSRQEQQILYSWIAYQVQKKERPLWMVYAVGGQGTGKTFLGYLLGACFYPHFSYTETTTIANRFGRGAFENARFVLIDEGSGDDASGRRLANDLKTWITQGWVPIEKKYVNVSSVQLHALVYMATNHELTMHVGEGDRRPFVLRIDRKLENNRAAALNRWFRGTTDLDMISAPRPEVCWALFDYFSRFEIPASFDPVNAPLTAAKQAIIDGSSGSEEDALAELMTYGTWGGVPCPEIVSLGNLAQLLHASGAPRSRADWIAYTKHLGRKARARGCLTHPVRVRTQVLTLCAYKDIAKWAALRDRKLLHRWAKAYREVQGPVGGVGTV